MTGLALVLPKLEKLVPRLASDADGEVVATVRAIDRALRSHGLDWHDLTAALAPAALIVEAGRPQTWQDMAEWCAHYGAHALEARELSFVLNMVKRTRRGRAPSEKQAKWMKVLYAKLGGPQ